MKAPSALTIVTTGFAGLIAGLFEALHSGASSADTATVLLVSAILFAGLWALRSSFRLSGETATWLSPGTVFICFIALHFVTSYEIARLIYDFVMPSDTNGFRDLLMGFDIYLVALLSVCAGFVWGAGRRYDRGRWEMLFETWRHFVARLNESTVLAAACAVALVGICMCVFVYHAVGVVPILSNDPASRYFGPEYTSQSFLYNSLFRRGVVLLTVASPILILGWLKRRKSIGLSLPALLAVLTLVASTRRGPLVFVVICVFLVYALFGLRLRVLLGGVALSLAILLVLQFAVLGGLNRTGPNSFAIDAAITYGEVFGEVREFAWLLSEWEGNYFYGTTVEAALLPLPETASSFKARNLMSSETKSIVGIPEDAPHGGLRVLIFGEAYLNFGYPGVVLVALLFGWALAAGDRFFWEIRRRSRAVSLDTIAVLPCVYLYAVLCYEIYLGGSVALADSLLAIAVLLLVYWIAARRPAGSVAV